MGYKLRKMDDRRVLITGGVGFIGSNLAFRLVELGADVTLYTHSKNKLANIKGIEDKVEVVTGDIKDFNSVKEHIVEKDYVFHLAGQVSNITSMENPLLDLDVNCRGTLNVLEACRRHNDGAKIIFSCTTGQFGKVKNLPATESLKDEPINIYDLHKLTAEKYCRVYYETYSIPTVSLRFATLFGERQQVKDGRTGVVNFFIRRAMLGEPITIYGDGKFLRDYVYIGNAADALILSAQSPKTDGDFFIVATGKGIKFVDMVKTVINMVKEVTGKLGSYTFVPFPENVKKIDVGSFVGSYDKLNKATGWFPKISFEEGVRRTVLFYKERLEEYVR